MQPLSNYRSDCGVYSATVHLHRNKYIGKTSTGLTETFNTEHECEAWCEDFVQGALPETIKIVNDGDVIMLMPRKGVFDD